jgi:hypothetical protein
VYYWPIPGAFDPVRDPLNVPHFSRPKYRFKPYDRLSDERQPVLGDLEVLSGVKPKKVKRVSATARGRMFRIGAFSRLLSYRSSSPAPRLTRGLLPRNE